MSTSDKLVVRANFEDASNVSFSIPSYKEGSATKANFQVLANAAKDVLETADGAAFSSIANANHVITSETNLNAVAELPISPSE